MKKSEQIPTWLSGTLIAGALGLLWLLERRRPLRTIEVEPKLMRNARNLTVAGAAAVALALVERPVVGPLSHMVEKNKWGLLKRLLALPSWVEVVLAVVLIDYTLYWWHVLTHRVPFLWRFHVAHHVDLDMDASTALRFHFGELAISTCWRAAQVVLIGVSPLSLSIWQNLLFLSILFHHSNVRLPIEFERQLNRVIVTPRMHGIHHSFIREETDANWSSGLSVWDWLHGTLRLNVPQSEITIGVPAYRRSEEVWLTEVLTMPFAHQRKTWNLPGDGQPRRIAAASVKSERLLP